ncbi:MAG TPA: sulfotransferase [Balneolaceae bacterium]|nr:sulfotransferase [Balneolaceae bacterium]
MKRIHIVGVSPRTGTTLMTEAIKTCFDIDYYTTHEDQLFTRAPGNPEIYLTKCPRDIMIVGPSLKVDPNLYVICMIRDPRDIVCSKHKKDPDRYWASLKYWKTYSKVVRSLADHPRFIPVYYESFVSDPDEVQTMISEKIPFLKQKIRFSEYHEAATVSDSSEEALRGVRPIKPVSVGKWKSHKPRVAGQLQQHGAITRDLINFGYETNDEWLNELRGIKPDLSPSHYSEYMTFMDKQILKFGRNLEAARRIIELLIRRRIRITHPKKWFR